MGGRRWGIKVEVRFGKVEGCVGPCCGGAGIGVAGVSVGEEVSLLMIWIREKGMDVRGYDDASSCGWEVADIVDAFRYLSKPAVELF